MSQELTRDELLVLLIEECAEVIQAATKCLRFGWDREFPPYGRNGDTLAKECGELSAVIDALGVRGQIFAESYQTKLDRAKSAKVRSER